MKLFGIEIRRTNDGDRLGELEKAVQSLASQAVTVTSLKEAAAQLSGHASRAGGVGNSAFPFGPLSPLRPMGQPAEQQAGPRRWQYPIGANIQYIPRTGEQVSFAELRNFARLYDVARICIQVRKEELQGIQWDITAQEEGREDEFAVEIAEERKFWAKPDRKSTFDDWCGLLLEDIFVVDAMTIHKQRTRAGELYALRAIAGDTIHPVIDEVGETYGYQQIIYGVPRTAYIDPDYAAAFPDADKVRNIFPISELIYRPRVLMPDSVYGFPPLEWVIVTVNQALRKQIADLKYYTEGNMPDVLLPMPDGTTIEQTLAFQEDFDALLKGNPNQRFGMLHFLPGGIDPGKAKEFRPFTTETAWDEMLLKKTCAAFGLSPQEIGFTADVNRATGEMQENVQYRRSIEPITQFLESLFTDIIGTDHQRPFLKFTFHVKGEKEDELKTAQTDEVYARIGATSVDEIRSRRKLGDPWGIDRPYVITTAGPVDLMRSLDASRALAAGATTPTDPMGMAGQNPGDIATDQDKAGPGHLFNADELRAKGHAESEQQGRSAEELLNERAQKALAATALAKEAATDAPVHTGVMIALAIPEPIGKQLLAIEDQLPVGSEITPLDELHLTLAFLGKAPNLSVTPETVASLLKVFAAKHGPLRGVIGGIGRFNGLEASDRVALYTSFDSPDLAEFRHDLVEMLEAAGILVGAEHGFTPHITLAYVPAEAAELPAEVPSIPAGVSDIVLAWGGQWQSIGLSVDVGKAQQTSALEKALVQWEENSLKRVSAGKRPKLDFTSDAISADIHDQLVDRLAKAQTKEEVKAAFAAPFRPRAPKGEDLWLGYP